MNNNEILSLDMNRVRSLMANCTNKRHRALKIPDLNPDTYIQSLVQDHIAKYPPELKQALTRQKLELAATELELTKTASEIQKQESEKSTYVQTIEKIKPQLQTKLTRLLSFFPERQHHIILDYFDEPDKILRRLDSNTNFLAKIFTGKSKEQEVKTLHTEILDLMRAANISTPESYENTINKNIEKFNSNIRVLNDKQKSLQKKLSDITAAGQKYQTQHEKLLADLHQDVAKFLYAYENRTELRKHIPPTLNMQGLTEPVAFFQTITNTTKSELENLLHHVDLKTGYKPNEYTVRETNDLYGNKCLELITPFYSPASARRNIETITKYLSEHGVTFAGVIKPATYSQINPTASNQDTAQDYSNNARITALIKEQLKSGISIDAFVNKYSQTDDETKTSKRKYIFRGQTFATSDTSSSYATPTWRTGRTGIVYGTPYARTSVTYATNIDGNGGANGQTMNAEHMLKVGPYIVGLVTVFENSPRNLWLSDRDLEDMTDKMDKQKNLKARHLAPKAVEETIISPANNPIVARYLAVGDTLVKIDDNPVWREILDYMAPDMRTTHIHGMQGNNRDKITQEIHGRQFLERLDALHTQKTTQGAVTTYDLPIEILEKMGYTPLAKQGNTLAQTQFQQSMIHTME